MTWADVRNRIQGYATLPDNWDSYGSPKPTSHQIGTWLNVALRLESLGFPAPVRITLASGAWAAFEWESETAWATFETGAEEGTWETGDQK
jgi:hypothetical protein